MATTPIEFDAPEGLTLTLELYPRGSDVLANGPGDAATEKTNDKGRYTASVTAAIAGWHTARIKDATNITVARYVVDLADDTNIHECRDSPQAEDDVYHADIVLTIDAANSRDEYTITWFRNDNRLTSGITSPTIQVVKRADGTNLIAPTALVQIGTTGSYKHDEPTSRTTKGEAVLAVVSATIDGETRTFSALLFRDQP